jgi:hypothetical protein
VRVTILMASLALSLLAGCHSDPPVVNVNASGGNNVAYNSAYEINEGQALDFVVAPATPGAKVTATGLPKNASFANNVFSFTPDYTQAGIYTVTFTITAGSTVTTSEVAIRVLNTLHIDTPALQTVNEGSTATAIMFPNNEPMGTVVNYSADLSAAPGASFDPVTTTLTFTPSWKWLDTNPAQVSIVVTAQATEPDTGKVDTSTARVLFEVQEATSFADEIVPIFMYPTGLTPTAIAQTSQPNWQAPEGHYCVNCHSNFGIFSPQAAAGMDLTGTGSTTPTAPNIGVIYNTYLFNVAPQQNMSAAGPPACFQGAAMMPTSTLMRVAPNDLANSLLYQKISGTDGKGNPGGPSCGVQMPNSLNQWYLTVSDQTAWDACPKTTSGDACRTALDCAPNDVQCAVNARYVHKVAVWINAGAPNN